VKNVIIDKGKYKKFENNKIRKIFFAYFQKSAKIKSTLTFAFEVIFPC